MIAIWKREFLAYFKSSIAFVFMGIFMLIAGMFVSLNNILPLTSDFVSSLNGMQFVFMLLVPILTMRLLSEERRNKTDQLLLCSPVSVPRIVLGKYFAAVSVFAVTLLVSAIYPVTMACFGTVSWWEINMCYLGFFLLGCALISVGVFMSSITENQVTSAVATFGVLLLMYLADSISSAISIRWVVTLVDWITIFNRTTDFSQGIISIGPVLYFASISLIFTFLAIRSVEKRRWSEG